MVVSERQRPARYAPTPWAQQKLYRPYVRAALLVALTFGFTPGVALLLELAIGSATLEWSRSAQLHGVAQVYGWAGLFIIGIASHIVPRFRGNARIAFPWPQRAVLILVVVGIGLNAVAQVLPGAIANDAVGHVLLAASGIALLAAMITFAVTLGGVLMRGAPSEVPFERWLWCGLGFAVGSALLQCLLAVASAYSGSPLAPEPLRQGVVTAGMFGFVGNFLFGVSLRATSGFLRLRPHRAGLERLAFVLVNAGVLALTLTAVAEGRSSIVLASTLLYTSGVIALTLALRIFEPPSGPRSDPRSARFLLVGYVWLVVAAAMLTYVAARNLTGSPGAFLALPALHAFAMGFVTMTIFGFAARVLPLLEGKALPSPRLVDAAFILLNASVVLRLVGSLGTGQASTTSLAISGVLGLAALVCFIPVAWPLSGDPKSGAGAAAPVRAGSTPA